MKELVDLKEDLMAKIVAITQKSKILISADVNFFRTDLKIVKDLDALGAQVKESINELVKIGTDNETLDVFDGPDVDYDFSPVVDVLDDIYEKAVRTHH
jgi:hypothetical protein